MTAYQDRYSQTLRLLLLAVATTTCSCQWHDGFATKYDIDWGSQESQPSCASGLPTRGSLSGPYGANIVAVGDDAGDLPFRGSGTTNLCGICMRVRCNANGGAMWGNTAYCRQGAGEVVVQIRDTCPECRPDGRNHAGLTTCGPGCTGYHVDLFREPFEALASGSTGVIAVQFQQTSCNFAADMRVWYRKSLPYYDSFVIQGTDRPINEVWLNDWLLSPTAIGTIGGQSWNINGEDAHRASYPATIKVVASDGSVAWCHNCIPDRGHTNGLFGSFSWTILAPGAVPEASNPPPPSPLTPAQRRARRRRRRRPRGGIPATAAVQDAAAPVPPAVQYMPPAQHAPVQNSVEDTIQQLATAASTAVEQPLLLEQTPMPMQEVPAEQPSAIEPPAADQHDTEEQKPTSSEPPAPAPEPPAPVPEPPAPVPEPPAPVPEPPVPVPEPPAPVPEPPAPVPEPPAPVPEPPAPVPEPPAPVPEPPAPVPEPPAPVPEPPAPELHPPVAVSAVPSEPVAADAVVEFAVSAQQPAASPPPTGDTTSLPTQPDVQLAATGDTSQEAPAEAIAQVVQQAAPLEASPPNAAQGNDTGTRAAADAATEEVSLGRKLLSRTVPVTSRTTL